MLGLSLDEVTGTFSSMRDGNKGELTSKQVVLN